MASSDSTASETCAAESVVDVKALLVQGQQSVKSGDVTAAIEKFKEACSVLESQFGEGAVQVAEAYLHYGQALLLKSSDDRPAIPETKSAAAADAAPGGAGDTVLEESKENSAESAATVGDLASGDPDAAGNVQLAEKVLGYAKDAFSSGDENETKVKYSSALLGLAKCSLEKKAYDVSISLLEQNLEVQKALSEDKPEVSLETYYLLGVCYNATKNQVDALKALNLGKTVGNDILASTGGESADEKPSTTTVADLLKKIEVTIEAVLAEQGGITDSIKASEEVPVEPVPEPVPAEPVPEPVPAEPVPEPVPACITDVDASDKEELPQDSVVADAVPAVEGEELKSDAECVEKTDEALPSTESADTVLTAVQSNGTCNKRPLHEEDHEVVKKAKHDADGSENGENDVDASAAADTDGICEEPCST